jgi:formylglycine-generating enzyme required for sulfatase activity
VDVGSYRPNAWGLYDMHGNAAEWTRSVYAAYPYRDDDGRNEVKPAAKRAVRGGSWYDRPKRCGSAFRLAYREYQPVYNVGFRIVCTGRALHQARASADSANP